MVAFRGRRDVGSRDLGGHVGQLGAPMDQKRSWVMALAALLALLMLSACTPPAERPDDTADDDGFDRDLDRAERDRYVPEHRPFDRGGRSRDPRRVPRLLGREGRVVRRPVEGPGPEPGRLRDRHGAHRRAGHARLDAPRRHLRAR